MVQSQQAHRPALRSVLEAYVTVNSAAYTAKGGDRVIGINRTGAVTLTLPSAEVRKGRIYTIKDESGAAATNNITVATEGSETIDGSATDVINVNYESKSYYSDGTNWFILPVTSDTQNSYEAPGLTLGTSNAEGTGNSIRSGATVALFDATNPSTQAHGDAAAVGSAAVAARRDHKHAMPAGGTDISVRVRHSVDQSIANAANTFVAFDTEDYDTDAMHDTVTNNTRITIKTAGKYILAFVGGFDANTTGHRVSSFVLNGTDAIGSSTHPAGESGQRPYMSLVWQGNFVVNDYIEVQVRQDSGGALNLKGLNPGSPSFQAMKVLG